MCNKAKVSVVIPFYNPKKYFDRCIQSIRSQSYENLEIIIVNDGSTEEYSQIAQKWPSIDNRIRVINKENEGTSFARRDGYLSATGKYVTFVDNDDFLPHHSIETLVRIIEENEVDLVMGSIIRRLGIINRDQNYEKFPVNEVVKQPALFDDYYLGFFGCSLFAVNVWGRLYRRSIIDIAYNNTELFSSELPCMAGDEYFNLKLFPYLRSMYFTNEPVYYYRYGGTVDGYNRFFPEILKLSDMRLKLLDQYHYTQGYKPLFVEYINCFYYHAQQLIEFKQADRNGVIDYFRGEIENRELLPRLLDWFYSNGIEKEGLCFIANKDYDGMYEFAYNLMKKRCNSFRYRCKQLYKKVLTLF